MAAMRVWYWGRSMSRMGEASENARALMARNLLARASMSVGER